MRLIKMKSILIFFGSLLLLSSCRENKNTQILYHIKFPDTIYRGESVNGEIYYSSEFEKLTKNFVKKDTVRTLNFYMNLTDNLDYNNEYLLESDDYFSAIDYKTIPFYDVSFKETGTFYIDGIILDRLYCNTFKKDKEGEYIFNMSEIKLRVKKKIVVIDSIK